MLKITVADESHGLKPHWIEEEVFDAVEGDLYERFPYEGFIITEFPDSRIIFHSGRFQAVDEPFIELDSIDIRESDFKIVLARLYDHCHLRNGYHKLKDRFNCWCITPETYQKVKEDVKNQRPDQRFPLRDCTFERFQH